MTTMAVALDRNLFLAYYSSFALFNEVALISSNLIERKKGVGDPKKKGHGRPYPWAYLGVIFLLQTTQRDPRLL